MSSKNELFCFPFSNEYNVTIPKVDSNDFP